MDVFRILILIAYCAIWHFTPTHGQSQIDTNVLARLEHLEKQVIGHKTQLDVQSKLITELQTRVTSQESLIAQHQATIDEQQTTIHHQQKTKVKQHKDISNLQSSISKHHRRLLRLERILVVDKTDNGKLAEDMADANTDQHEEFGDGFPYMHPDPSETENDKDTLQDRTIARFSNRRSVMESEAPVAFHAINTAGPVSHVGIGQNIMFPTVMVNLGSGYHSQHGVFIAPAAGLYMFSTSILSSNEAAHTEVQVELKKNGVALARAYAHGDAGRHDQGSITIVTQLAIGDEVWVSESYITDASYYGGSFTSFMGYLLWPL